MDSQHIEILAFFYYHGSDKLPQLKGHTNGNRQCACALAWFVLVLCAWYVVVPSDRE